MPDQRTLEVGGGTGWNAKLLTRHLGDETVTTVAVDEAVAGSARQAGQPG